MKDNCRKYSARVAIDYYGKKYTYKELLGKIDETADALATQGIKEGDYVSICSLATPECIFAFYALNKIGAVCNMIEPRTNADRILFNINNTNSSALLVLDAFLDKIESIKGKIKTEKIIVLRTTESMPFFYKSAFGMSAKGKNINAGYKKFDGLKWEKIVCERISGKAKEVSFAPNTPIGIVYTGGTTGVPKGAVVSSTAFANFAHVTPFSAPQIYASKVFLDIMPPFIAYGLVFGMLIPFCAGLKCILIPAFKVEDFPRLLKKHKPNCVVGVPSFYESLLHCREFTHRKLDFLTCAIAGGDKLLLETENAVNEFFKSHGCKSKIYKGYGMTEMGSAVTFTTSDECNEVGSVGISSIISNVKICDEVTGEELKYNAQGDIYLSGPTMMYGYFGNPEETSKVMQTDDKGVTWIRTGDIGYVSKTGILYVIDRKKRMIIRPDGHNVWPSLIEAVVVKHEAVADCCVIGTPNPNGNSGKIPTAVIVLNEGYEDIESIINEVNEISRKSLPERDMALRYEIIDKMPVTDVGKVDYMALERMFA